MPQLHISDSRLKARISLFWPDLRMRAAATLMGHILLL